MSQKNSKEAKALRRLRRALQVSPPGKLDLVQYLIDRGHASSIKAARELILAGRVRADSHRLGVKAYHDPLLDKQVEYVDPIIPTEFRDRIMVLSDG
jgi:hypothetical protein